MISDKESEIKVKKYANDNRYTILANTFGALEFVKYCYEEKRLTEFLKWTKGSSVITVTREGISKKINLSDIGK